tara:strand:- start:405 stop:743 length:339 start_codon:yes stop_codon:yes gene_type:complete
MSRYDDKKPLINNSEKYDKIFEERGVKFIKHYSTPELTHAQRSEIATLNHSYHVWKLGDKLYKLSAKYYNSEKLWWIIAWYNKSPTESYIKPGQVLKIPQPLESVASILRIK